MGTANLASAQTCIHTDLSKNFDYTVTRTMTMSKLNGEVHRYSKIVVIISGKKTRSVQKIVLEPGYLDETAYRKCNAVRSYITEQNDELTSDEGEAGDLIVVDLDFDGREDIAVKSDSGGASGPGYAFYLQDENGRFVKDKYLSEEMYYFPWEINARKKTLTTNVTVNYTQIHRSVFKYDPATRQWKSIKNVFLKSEN
jgi:hypothetical protein